MELIDQMDQEWGDPLRARAGIHGGYQAAQQVAHAYSAMPGVARMCVLCRLEQRAGVHRGRA